MENKKFSIKGIIGTVLFHVLIFIIFMLTGFRSPLPSPKESGIEIQGGSSLGSGEDIDMEAAASSQEASDYVSSSENYASQNFEESSYSVNKNNVEETKPNITQTEKPKKWVPSGSLLNSGNSGAGNSGGNGSFGNGGGNGAGNSPGDGKGTGVGPGTGIGYSLTGRTSSYLPAPSKNFSEEGTIVVTIWVDKNGNVTRAATGARGSTSTNSQLRKLALEAAKKSKFHPKYDAPEEQMGTITYVFRLD